VSNIALKVEASSLSTEQQHAVEMCCDMSNEIVGITGGAGTGKTLVLGHVFSELRQKRVSAVLCAPTGRAAKRVQELTGITAKTVHRLLEFPQPDEFEEVDPEHMNEPKRNKTNPLIEKVIIVDESSMIGPTLFRQLMDALPKGSVVRFFGDNNQLPPVEEGEPPFISVLKKFPSIELMFNFRSDDAIVGNAVRILSGRIPVTNPQFQVQYSDNPIDTMLKMVGKEFMDEACQIIMPTRKGKYGTMRVNPSLQVRFNKRGPMLLLDRYDEDEAKLVLRKNDKFLWVKNDYKLEMFNGEIGTVDSIDDEDGSFKLRMQDRVVEVPARMKTYSPWHRHVIDYDPRKQVELGYAITTHKSQGSEFHTIIYCITKGQAYLLNRRNFYTAITRAKKNVVIITDRRAMGLSMKRHEH
jgi:exodeoxyribonuclease V alpha subunit